MRAEDRDDDIEPDDMLPSVEMTMRFLALSDPGSEEAAIAATCTAPAELRAGVTRPRRLSGLDRRDLHGAGGVACGVTRRGLPVRDDCPAWNAPENQR